MHLNSLVEKCSTNNESLNRAIEEALALLGAPAVKTAENQTSVLIGIARQNDTRDHNWLVGTSERFANIGAVITALTQRITALESQIAASTTKSRGSK